MALQHKGASFDFEGSVTVETIQGHNTCRVTLNGVPSTSGCENGAIGELFGVEDIIQAAETDIVLNAVGLIEITDYICNLEESEFNELFETMKNSIEPVETKDES